MTKRKEKEKQSDWVTITEAVQILNCGRHAFTEFFHRPSWWCRRSSFKPSKYGWRWELSRSFVLSLPALCDGDRLTMRNIRGAVRRLDSEQYTDTAGLRQQIIGYRSVLKSETARLESALTVQSSYLYDHKATMDSLQEYREKAMHLEFEVSALRASTESQERYLERLSKRHNETKKERDQAITARDKWAKDHARQKKEIEALKAGPVSKQWSDTAKAARAEKERDEWIHDHGLQRGEIEALKARDERQKKEIQALKLELQTYADTYAESKPPAVIDRLVSAVESAPLDTLMQIDQPRHAALRRVVGLWTAVDHAVGSFYPGDSAQTNNNNDDEVK